MHDMSEYLQYIYAALEHWGVVIVFIALFVECIPFIGFLVPGLSILMFAGFIAGAGSIEEGIYIWLAAFFAVWLADTFTYFLGRYFVPRSARVRSIVEKNRKVTRELLKQNNWLLMLYQFPPYSRMFAPVLLGAAGFSWPRWFFVVTGGSAFFVSVFLAIGWSAGHLGKEFLGATELAKWVGGVFLVCLTIWLTSFVRKILREEPTDTA